MLSSPIARAVALSGEADAPAGSLSKRGLPFVVTHHGSGSGPSESPGASGESLRPTEVLPPPG
jgi:hypothetical protein